MEPALAGRPVREFPEPRQPVSFVSWERGPSSLSYDPYYVPPAPSEPEAPAKDEDTPSGKRSSGGDDGASSDDPSSGDTDSGPP